MSMKNPLTPAGIEPATFQFVAQHLNHCATAVPSIYKYVAIFQCIEFYQALPVTKGINFKSGKLNENKQSLRKSMY